MDEPRETTFRGKPATVYTWRRHSPDRWRWTASATGMLWTERGMLSEWEVDRACLMDGRADHFMMDAMRYW